MQAFASEAIEHGVRAAPPVLVSATSVMGVPLESWVYIVTIIYVCLQIGFLVYRWVFKHRDRQHRRDNNCRDQERD